METRIFGATGLGVGVIGFGAGHIGGEGQEEGEVSALLNGLLDAGVTLIDTARGYGRSEERIGRHIAHRRDEFVLSTKCGYGIDGIADWTHDTILRGVDEALRLLRTDRIDIMHFHSCPRHVLEHHGVMDALEKTREAGKVRFLAYSGENEDLAYALQTGRFDSIQTSVNLCDQRGIARYLTEAISRNLGVIAKRPIANAFWRFAERPVGEYCEEYWHRARVMNLAPPDGMDWMEFALRFTLTVPGVHSLIAGSSRWDHMREIIELAEKGPLSEVDYENARAAFSAREHEWQGQC